MPISTVHTTLQEIAADENVCNAIREAIIPNWQETFLKKDADCAPGYMGSVCYHLDVPDLTKALRPLGWERQIFEGQVRWLNRTRYSRPVMLVTSSADEEVLGVFRVAGKGFASRCFTGQLDLPFEEFQQMEVTDSDNYWIMKDLKISPFPTEMPDIFKLTLASLVFQGNSTLVVDGSKGQHVLYHGQLFPFKAPSEVPAPSTSEVVITEIDAPVVSAVTPANRDRLTVADLDAAEARFIERMNQAAQQASDKKLLEKAQDHDGHAPDETA